MVSMTATSLREVGGKEVAMGDEFVGRAGFHVKHTKAPAERGPILHEAMRSIVPGAVEYWAARNPNIVVADQHLDEQYVNDGEGGFVTCTDPQQVIDYGASRMEPERLSRQMTEDVEITKGPRKGRRTGGTLTTSLFVLHLPKSMCVEVPGYYPRFHEDGSPMLHPVTGEQMRRSRWVAKDRDQARRFFEDEIDYLAAEVIPGGREAILGYSIQHSESTSHIQIVADTLAPDPKKEGKLRWDAARAYYSHRESMVPVLDEQGEPVMRTDKQGELVLDDDGNPQPKRRMLQGREKLAAYHEGLKAHLVELGYDISPDFDEERHLIGQGKDDYVAAQDARAQAAAEREAIEGPLAEKAAELDRRWEAVGRVEAEWSEGNPEQGVEPGPRYVAARTKAREAGRADLAAERRAAEEARKQAEEEHKLAAEGRERAAEAMRLATAAQQEAAADQERARDERLSWARKVVEVAALAEEMQTLLDDGQSAPEAFDAAVAATVDALRGTTSGSVLKPMDVELAKETVAEKRPQAVNRQKGAALAQRAIALAEELEAQAAGTADKTDIGEE